MESNLIKLEKDFTLQLEQLQNQIASLNLEGVYVGTDSEEIGKIHKYKHTWFLMKGKLLMGSPTGNKEITAPAWGTSPAGTKRIVYVLEDCIFINVFPDLENTKNIESIVDNVSFDTYAGFEEFALQQNLIKKIN